MQTASAIWNPSFSDDDLECRKESLTTGVSPSLHRLISRSQPHQVLSFLRWAANREPEQIAVQHSDSSLNVIASDLDKFLKSDARWANSQLPSWLDAIKPNLFKSLGDLLHPDNAGTRQRYEILLHRPTGATPLSAYYELESQREGDLVRWCKNSVELPLIAAAQDGNRGAFDRLHERYKGMVFGSISFQTRNDAEAKDLAQETWIKAWKEIQMFDPAWGSFASFIKCRARIVLLRHFSKRKRRLKFEQLLSDLGQFYPDVESQDDVREMLAHFSAEPAESELFTKVPDEIVDQLLETVFGVAGPVHHSFAFAYLKLLQWKPSEVVDELSSVPFGKLFENLRESLMRTWSLSNERVDHCLRPLRDQLRDYKLAQESFGNHYSYPTQHRTKNGEEMTETEQNADDLRIFWTSVRRRVIAEIADIEDGPLCEWLDEHFQD